MHVRALGLISAALFSLVLGPACLFPGYTFDEPEPSGGSGGATTTSATTTGSPTTTTTTTASSMTGGGEGGGPPTEDCFEAGDEDGDSMSDCADPDCSPDLECVDPIPVGWGAMGYLALFQGAAGSDPACPKGADNAVYDGNATLTGGAAQCTACGCATPTWSSCELFSDWDVGKSGFQGLYAGDQTCPSAFTGGVTLTTPQPWAPNTCSNIDQSPGMQMCTGGPCNTAVKASLARPANGTCMPTGGTPVMTTPTWQEGMKACRANAGLQGCTGGQTCVPRPAAPYESRICIGRAGDQACPAGDFSLKTVAYGDFTDDRDCTGCTCGAGANGTCTLSIELFSDGSCTSPIGTVNSNSCVNLTGNPTVASRRASVLVPPAGGSCPVTGGGVPTGGVTEADPTTFCCLPP